MDRYPHTMFVEWTHNYEDKQLMSTKSDQPAYKSNNKNSEPQNGIEPTQSNSVKKREIRRNVIFQRQKINKAYLDQTSFFVELILSVKTNI